MDLNDILDEEIDDGRNETDSESHGSSGLSSPLASTESTMRSLAFVRSKDGGINDHRRSLLRRVPEQESWARVPRGSVEDLDLAYLSAYTGDEFALLCGRQEDILFHGTPAHCHIEKSEYLMTLLESHKARLEVHSHPDTGKISASQDDRDFIARFGQETSRIVSSYTGQIAEFHSSVFNDIV